jgi:hypothetical protein
MSTCPIIIKPTQRPRRSDRRGSIALVALTALVVVFIIGLGLLTLGGNARLSGKRAMRLSGAQTMASSGVEYGYWQVLFNNQPLPYSSSRSLGSGSFTVTVTDNSASLAGTVKIVSTGAQSGDNMKLTRVMKGKSVYDYALSLYNDFSDGGKTLTLGSSGVNSDFYENGSVQTDANTTVNGNVKVVGAINSPFKSVTGTTTAGVTALPFSALDTSATGPYALNATATYPSSQTWSNFTFPSTGAIIYITGNLTLSGGTITGTGTIVCTGQLQINGNVSSTFSSDKMAFLAGNGIVVNAAATVTGIYYTDNPSRNAPFTIKSQFTLTSGSLICDTLTVNIGPISVIHDPNLNPAVYRQLHLPGY